MTSATLVPINDPDRLAALQRTALLDTPAEEAFDRLARLAAHVLRAPVGLISLVDEHRQFFKSCVGLTGVPAQRRETPLAYSFCQHVVVAAAPLVIADAREHPLLWDNLAVSDLGVVAYAGVPLVTSDGYALGSFCVLDTVPREWSVEDVQVLSELAAAAMTEVELRRELADRRCAEAALRESEERYRLMFEGNPWPMWVYDVATRRVLAVNEAAVAHYGYGRDEWLRMTLDDFRPPEDLPLLDAIIAALPAGRGATRLVRHRKKDGTVLNVEVTGHPLTYDGRPARVALAVDVTQRRAAEDAVRSANETLRAIIDAAPQAIIAVDPAWNVTRWNLAAERLFGWRADEVVGRPLPIVPPETLAEFRSHQGDVAREGGVRDRDVWRTRKDGTLVEVRVSTGVLHGADGAPQGLIGIFVDTTEQKQLEAQLRQAQRLEAIGQLAAGIAHEINTPVQYVNDNVRFLEEAYGGVFALLARAEVLVQAAREADLLPDHVAAVDTAAQLADVAYLETEVPAAIRQSLDGLVRIAEIVRSVKAFSHPGTGATTGVDLNRELANTSAVSRSEWKYVADVSTDFDAALPPVTCLTGELNQVFLNVLVNAAHAVADVVRARPGAKGAIAISTRRDGEWAEVRIRDTGDGIPEAVRPRVFDPFFTTKPVGQGTGQGLAIAHSVVVDKHGGTITFDTQLDVGTTFVIRLPIGGPRAKAPGAAGSAP
jgi:PAS domain S-box-containing protein